MSRTILSQKDLTRLLNETLAAAECGDCEVLPENIVCLDNTDASGCNWDYVLTPGFPILRGGHVTVGCERVLRRAVADLRMCHSLLTTEPLG